MSLLEIRQYVAPTRLIHGAGSVTRVGPEAKMMGGTRVFVVSDAGVAAAGLLEGVVCSLQEAGLGVETYTDVPWDPDTVCVARGVDLLRAADCDIIVTVGGGSPMCAAKAIAIVATNGGEIRDYEGFGKPTQRPLPTICIPTTAGSGTEVSAVTIITDMERYIKMAIGTPLGYPPLAILDPELLVSLPFRQAAASSVDALSHAIEACLTTQATPLTNALALGAIELFGAHMVAAAKTRELEPKAACLLASSMANMACGNARLGLNHALTWPISSLFGVPHGLANGIMLPYTLEYILPAAIPQLSRIAMALGVVSEGREQEKLAQDAVTCIKQLMADLEFPTHFTTEQLDRTRIPEMVDMLMQQGIYALFRQVTLRVAGPEDMAALYERSLQGW